MKKLVLLTFCIALTSYGVFAQQDLTLYELRSAPQSHGLNPSKIPLSKGYVLLPVLSGGYTAINSEGFTLSDAVQPNESTGKLDVTLDKAIDRMKDINSVNFDFRTTVLGFGFRAGAGFASFAVENKTSVRFAIPKSFFEFLWLGNGDPKFLGQRASFDGLGIDYMQYTEVAFGYARDFNDKWTVGLKAKYLSGQGFLRTTESTLGISTNADNYAITLDGQLAVQAAGIPGVLIDSLLGFGGLGIDELGDQIITSGTGNHGGAIDLGITYKINEVLSASASVLDVGLINWSASAKTKTSKPISYTYDGLPLTDFSEGSAEPENLIGTLDTLVSNIEFDEKEESFTTLLPVKIYLGGDYRILPKTNLSALTYNEYYNGRFKTSLRVAVTQKVRNFLMATVNYSIYGNSAANVGAGFTINGGPVQFYTVTDNVIAFLLPEKSKNVHLRFGINLTFGNNFSQN